jgi:hypothetical protein
MPWFMGPENVPTHWIGPLPQGAIEIPAPVIGEYEAKAEADRKAASDVAAAELAAAAAAPAPKSPDYDPAPAPASPIVLPAKRGVKKAGK